jgi:ABC-2 type transport system permease protein
VAIAVMLWLVMVAISGPAKLTGVSAGELAATNLQLALFGISMAAIAYAVGAGTGRRALTLGASAGFAVLRYLAAGLLPRVPGLHWVRNLSPFHWYLGGDPLDNGFQAGYAALLLGFGVVLVAAGTWLFNRRDLGTALAIPAFGWRFHVTRQ